MTILNAPEAPSVNHIAARAAEYPFFKTVTRLVLTTILSVFFSIGWVPGTVWYGFVFSLLWIGHHLRWIWDTTVYGFRVGAHVKTEARK